ncbi:MAG: TrmH family RNA methyltransferase [Deltaproteobacteria bacterium]|nr:TrmH family RNA methyltransferase [Deltaproteobacteria bacterium]
MTAKVISSKSNPRFKTLAKLLKSPGIRKHGRALLSGPRQVRELLRDFPHCCEALLLPEKDGGGLDVAPERIERLRLSADLFQELDLFGTHQPMLLVRVPEMRAWDGKTHPRGCTLFVPFQDPANVGTVIRSAAGFGAARVVLLREAAHPFLPKALRAGGSAPFRVPIEAGPSISGLKGGSLPIIGLQAGGLDPAAFRFPDTFGLLPGLEGPGLPEIPGMKAVLGIPMEPGMDSLNGALAAGIALYAWRTGPRFPLDIDRMEG